MPAPERLAFRIFACGVTLPVLGFLGVEAVHSWQTLRSQIPDLFAWAFVVLATDLMPVPFWGGVLLGMSLPILLAAGIVFSPSAVGLVALVASTDPREVRRQVSLLRAMFNRSQIALSVMLFSAVFHVLGGDLKRWPLILLVALPALTADFAVNVGTVMIGARLLGMSVKSALKKFHGGEPAQFLLSYVCFGLVAVVLATAYRTAGNWGLLAFLTPVLLARQTFARGQRLSQTSEVLAEKNRMLVSVSERIADERRDERLTVAAGLHDDVLPPLYKVHLMGQVLRQDLAAGRLLALEDDLPELLEATEFASDAMRVLIRDLRQSPLGSGGLTTTLNLLIRNLESESSAQIDRQLDEVGGSPVVQLLAYQVAREALRNAIRHAGARQVRVRLTRVDADMRLVVEDDGRGFDQDSVDRESHFGLQLMRERVELAGGVLQITSRVGEGTQVVVRLPSETSY